jgi:hypothetical protein
MGPHEDDKALAVFWGFSRLLFLFYRTEGNESALFPSLFFGIKALVCGG